MSCYEVKDDFGVNASSSDVRLTGFTCNQAQQDISISMSMMDNECSSQDNKLRQACQRLQKSFGKKLLYKRVPIFEWLPKYRKEYIISDIVAGLTVGLTVIPQAIAYANVAGLPLQYGLYSSFMACFVYTIFGSSKDVPVGPTAIGAILTRGTLDRAQAGPDFAVLLTFVAGLVSLLMGILQLGFLIDFISGPVSVGFTSAAALIIATSQVKDVLGLKVSGQSFSDVWHKIFEHICETRLWDCVMGIVCMIVLLLLRKVQDIPVRRNSTSQKAVKKVLWFLSTARNILVVIVGSIIAWMLERQLNSSPVILTGHVKEGLPIFQPPPFSSQIGNHTYGFSEMVSMLGSGCFVVPLLSMLESISLAKVFSDGKAIDATQEMLALGACNVVSSFVSSMPVTGGLSRGAVNHSSGVKTQFGSVYTGLLVILSLQFLTPYLYYIPKAVLAAVIIASVIFMVEFQVVKPMWRTKKIDLLPASVTFFSCLFVSLELGMLIGIGVNILFLLYASARPSLRVQKVVSPAGCEYLMITPDRSISFPSVEYVRASISKHGSRLGNKVPVVIDSTHIQAADFTAAKGVKNLIEDFAKRGQPLIFLNLKASVGSVFRGVKPLEMRICGSEAELYESLTDLTTTTTTTTTSVSSINVSTIICRH